MKKLNLMCPINDLGYGVAGKNICKSLEDLTNVYLFPIGTIGPDDMDEKIRDVASRQDFDHNAPCLKIWHEFDMATRVGGGKLFGYPFFEVNKFNFQRKHNLESCDSVIVASKWAAEVVREETTQKNINVVPLGVDMKTFHPPVDELYKQDKCIFFNCGKWETRKGHDILLDLFREAFPDENDVELWMMCQNPLLDKDTNERWNNHYRQDFRVQLINRVKSQQELAQIMRHITCGIFPSRAEGWNLEALEVLAVGKDLIITDYGAHQEFCTEENSYLVKPEGMEIMLDGVYFTDTELGATWVDIIQVKDQFIQAMRDVYEKWKSNGRVTHLNMEGIQTGQLFNWTSTAKSLIGILNE
jgi:glycosyltransferase involved in cell wall biosynthesis